MTANLCHDLADTASSEERRASDRQESAAASVSTADAKSTATSIDATAAESSPDVAFDELLALLADEYACDILRALDDGPMPARTLVETCGMSRPTVYRRLDRLTAAGVVEARMQPDRDGHHRQVFHLVLDEIEFQVRADGINGTVRVSDRASD